ncbi:MAG: hypothetical protein CL677_04120 [Bdellovibrionaceae bacterium]|nr:hypothetical protein [Pseudobdellovibrionaceae bacterium]|tara:strand:- start:42840 stop:43400 length:561 start_codon:yes stop_codon:yes gene_type:complete
MGKMGVVRVALIMLMGWPAWSALRGDDGGTDPFPWGSPCQFKVESFEGFWAAKNRDGEAELFFNINIKNSGRGRILLVQQFKMIELEDGVEKAYISASGTGVFQNEGRQINAVMRPSEEFVASEPVTYWLYFHSFCDVDSGLQTYVLKLQDTEASENDPEAYVLERIEAPELIETFLRAYIWPPKY